MFTRTALAASLLAGVLSAQGLDPRLIETPRYSDVEPQPALLHPPKVAVDPATLRGGVLFDRVRYAAAADGAELARGATYKARFDAGGATYVPFLGSKAPRNHPVTFRLDGLWAGAHEIGFDSGAIPARAGDRVAFDRGSVVEIYDLRLDSVEQSLVFESLPASGELRVRYAVEGDLAPAEAEFGLAFENELGGVRYGRATAIDAAGRNVAAETAWVEGGIEIRVPAEFLASARFPLVVDPVVSSFAVDTTLNDRFSADPAYDPVRDRHLVAYEQAFSANDHDVVVQMYDSAGSSLGATYADLDIFQYWANPSVACSRHFRNYLVVAEVGAAGSREIWGRFVGAELSFPDNLLQLGSAVQISQPTESGEKVNPDVGNAFYDDSKTNFLVVWERVYSASDHDIHGRMIFAGGAVTEDTFYLDDSGGTYDVSPSVSESCSIAGIWHTAWERRIDSTNRDIHAAEVAWNGFVAIPSTPVVTGIADTRNAGVATVLDWGGQWLLVCQRSFAGSPANVQALLMHGTTVLDSVDLSALESTFGSGTLGEDQVSPEADSDGVGFAVAYSESYQGSATDYDLYLATLTPIDGRLFLSEGHQVAGYTFTHEDHPKVVCDANSGGGIEHSLVVWDDQVGGSNRDIAAARYDLADFTSFCFPGDDAVACPCGNPPAGPGRGCENSSGTGGAVLTKTGEASLSSDFLQFTTYGQRPTALSILAQGTTSTNRAFGQGVRCVGGQIKRMYSKQASGGSITAPQGSELPVSMRSAALGQPLSPGDTCTYMVYYRDPQVLGGCPAESGFNATQSARITWRP